MEKKKKKTENNSSLPDNACSAHVLNVSRSVLQSYRRRFCDICKYRIIVQRIHIILYRDKTYYLHPKSHVVENTVTL